MICRVVLYLPCFALCLLMVVTAPSKVALDCGIDSVVTDAGEYSYDCPNSVDLVTIVPNFPVYIALTADHPPGAIIVRSDDKLNSTVINITMWRPCISTYVMACVTVQDTVGSLYFYFGITAVLGNLAGGTLQVPLLRVLSSPSALLSVESFSSTVVSLDGTVSLLVFEPGLTSVASNITVAGLFSFECDVMAPRSPLIFVAKDATEVELSIQSAKMKFSPSCGLTTEVLRSFFHVVGTMELSKILVGGSSDLTIGSGSAFVNVLGSFILSTITIYARSGLWLTDGGRFLEVGSNMMDVFVTIRRSEVMVYETSYFAHVSSGTIGPASITITDASGLLVQNSALVFLAVGNFSLFSLIVRGSSVTLSGGGTVALAVRGSFLDCGTSILAGNVTLSEMSQLLTAVNGTAYAFDTVADNSLITAVNKSSWIQTSGFSSNATFLVLRSTIVLQRGAHLVSISLVSRSIGTLVGITLAIDNGTLVISDVSQIAVFAKYHTVGNTITLVRSSSMQLRSGSSCFHAGNGNLKDTMLSIDSSYVSIDESSVMLLTDTSDFSQLFLLNSTVSIRNGTNSSWFLKVRQFQPTTLVNLSVTSSVFEVSGKFPTPVSGPFAHFDFWIYGCDNYLIDTSRSKGRFVLVFDPHRLLYFNTTIYRIASGPCPVSTSASLPASPSAASTTTFNPSFSLSDTKLTVSQGLTATAHSSLSNSFDLSQCIEPRFFSVNDSQLNESDAIAPLLIQSTVAGNTLFEVPFASLQLQHLSNAPIAFSFPSQATRIENVELFPFVGKAVNVTFQVVEAANRTLLLFPPAPDGWPIAAKPFALQRFYFVVTLDCTHYDLNVRVSLQIAPTTVVMQEAVIVAADIASGSSIASGSGASAAVVARASSLQRLRLMCDAMATMDSLDEAAKGVIPFAIGEDAMKYSRGAVVVAVLVTVGVMVTSLAFAAAAHAIVRQRSSTASFFVVLCRSHFPSTACPCVMVMIPAVASAVAIMFAQSAAEPLAWVGLVYLLLSLSWFGGTVQASRILLRPHVRPASTRVAPSFVRGFVRSTFRRRTEWEAAQLGQSATFFLSSHVIMLDDVCVVWPQLADAVVSVVIGVVTSLKTSTPEACLSLTSVCAAIYGAQLALYLWIRPFSTMFSTVAVTLMVFLSLLSILLQLAATVVAARSPHSGAPSSLVVASSVSSLLLVGVSCLKTCVDVAGLLRSIQKFFWWCQSLTSAACGGSDNGAPAALLIAADSSDDGETSLGAADEADCFNGAAHTVPNDAELIEMTFNKNGLEPVLARSIGTDRAGADDNGGPAYDCDDAFDSCDVEERYDVELLIAYNRREPLRIG